MSANRNLIEKIETLQNVLVARATHDGADEAGYQELRSELLSMPTVAPKLPSFVRTCRDLSQFWGFIKKKFDNYADRREFIWGEFGKALNDLEGRHAPSQDLVTAELRALNAESVHQAWEKALVRIDADPEGAITQARTLLESTCKVILDEAGEVYEDGLELPKLYKKAASVLKLSPGQHAEQVFKQILGGCTSIVAGLGSLRNKFSDAHGKGKRAPRPSERHARFAVNLAGGMSMFLAETWRARQEES